MLEKRQQAKHVESFYHHVRLNGGETMCQGTACFVARRLDRERSLVSESQTARVYCLGKCYAGPASTLDRERPRVEVHSREPIVLERVVNGGAPSIQEYVRLGGYRTLEKTLRRKPEELVEEIETSRLRGRGGAGFGTGKKWLAVSREISDEKFVVANADEGDPGAFIDRFIIEEDPHSLIEGMTIAAYAVGARRGFVYLRAEYPDARAVLEAALLDARREGFLGARVLHTAFQFDVELIVGQGSYLCGEETALLNSIEGRRPEVRARPPYPTSRGLWGKPTLVNNVETLASSVWIARNGGEAYNALGFSTSRGTKVVSLNSLFRRPGLYEIEFGAPVRHIVEDLGGGLKTGSVKGLMIGGPLAGVIPPALFDTPFGFDELHAIGASVGHGGVVAFDDRTSIAELARHVFSFGAYESCGKCTPCRLGARGVERIFSRVLDLGHTTAEDRADLDATVNALAMTSLCGHGSGLAEFAKSLSLYYGKDLESCFG